MIPADRIDPAARALLAYIPLPNLTGPSQNFRRTATAATTTDGISCGSRTTSRRAAARARRPRRIRRRRRWARPGRFGRGNAWC
jgi:hypothetical protein